MSFKFNLLKYALIWFEAFFLKKKSAQNAV